MQKRWLFPAIAVGVLCIGLVSASYLVCRNVVFCNEEVAKHKLLKWLDSSEGDPVLWQISGNLSGQIGEMKHEKVFTGRLTGNFQDLSQWTMQTSELVNGEPYSVALSNLYYDAKSRQLYTAIDGVYQTYTGADVLFATDWWLSQFESEMSYEGFVKNACGRSRHLFTGLYSEQELLDLLQHLYLFPNRMYEAGDAVCEVSLYCDVWSGKPLEVSVSLESSETPLTFLDGDTSEYVSQFDFTLESGDASDETISIPDVCLSADSVSASVFLEDPDQKDEVYGEGISFEDDSYTVGFGQNLLYDSRKLEENVLTLFPSQVYSGSPTLRISTDIMTDVFEDTKSGRTATLNHLHDMGMSDVYVSEVKQSGAAGNYPCYYYKLQYTEPNEQYVGSAYIMNIALDEIHAVTFELHSQVGLGETYDLTESDALSLLPYLWVKGDSYETS